MSAMYPIFVAVAGIIFLTLMLIIHFKNHFQARFCKCISSSYSSHHKFICKISPKDGEEFNFFPDSFFKYLICTILTSMLIICILIIDIFSTNLQILHYILAYLILILSLFESLFAFYRYYTTYKTTKYFMQVSSAKVYKKFRTYALVFSLLFIAQLHFYFWIFPLEIALNFVFNLYCNWQFSHILIKQYQIFTNDRAHSSDAVITTNQDRDFELIHKLQFLYKISVVYTMLQSLSLVVFIITTNAYLTFPHSPWHQYYSKPKLLTSKYISNVVYFLPFLWCLSSAFYTFNFVRNIDYFKEKTNCIYHCRAKVEEQQSKEIIEILNVKSIETQSDSNTGKPTPPTHIQKDRPKMDKVGTTSSHFTALYPKASEDDILNAMPSTYSMRKLVITVVPEDPDVDFNGIIDEENRQNAAHTFRKNITIVREDATVSPSMSEDVHFERYRGAVLAKTDRVLDSPIGADTPSSLDKYIKPTMANIKSYRDAEEELETISQELGDDLVFDIGDDTERSENPPRTDTIEELKNPTKPRMTLTTQSDQRYGQKDSVIHLKEPPKDALETLKSLRAFYAKKDLVKPKNDSATLSGIMEGKEEKWEDIPQLSVRHHSIHLSVEATLTSMMSLRAYGFAAKEIVTDKKKTRDRIIQKTIQYNYNTGRKSHTTR